MTVSFGLSINGIVEPAAPGWPPGLRPEEPRDKPRAGLRYGGSDEGGLLEVDESLLRRRSSSVIRAASASSCPAWVSTWTACPAITSRNPAFVARNPTFAARNPAFAARSCTTSSESSATDGGSGSDTPP